MTFPEPSAQRLSDLERDAAASALRTHFEAGRLDNAEFAERLQATLGARTTADVAPLFVDLPEPHPAYLAEAIPTWNTYPAPGRAAETAPPVWTPQRPTTASSGALVPRTTAPVPATSNERMLDIVQAVIWPVAIVLLLFGNAGITPIIVAIVVSAILSRYKGKRRQPPPY